MTVVTLTACNSVILTVTGWFKKPV